MKLLGLVAMAVTMEIGARAEKVTVYVQGSSIVPAEESSQAQVLANRIFVDAGVRINWRKGQPDSSESLTQKPIVIEIVTETPRGLLPGALAYAQPYEGVHISVFYDRIQTAVPPDLTPNLLAHVLVHEITHILQGTCWHSESGVMKARWTPEDYQIMKSRPLRFTKEDLRLIHFGTAARTQRDTLIAATLVQ